MPPTTTPFECDGVSCTCERCDGPRDVDGRGPGFGSIRESQTHLAYARVVVDGVDRSMQVWAAQPGLHGWVAAYRHTAEGHVHQCARCVRACFEGTPAGVCSVRVAGVVDIQRAPPRRLCAQCGLPVVGPDALCRHHIATEDQWAKDNRAICDLLHRRKMFPRLDAADQD